jgi:type I restriction enzyme M protein
LVRSLREQLRDLEADLENSEGDEAAYSAVLIAALKPALKDKNVIKVVSHLESSIADLRRQADDLDLQARDAQAAGDRLYWPIYNLDLKNPNAPEEESHDPDVLLEKYKTLLSQIEETENRLKSELAAALAHHFTAEDSATEAEQ